MHIFLKNIYINILNTLMHEEIRKRKNVRLCKKKKKRKFTPQKQIIKRLKKHPNTATTPKKLILLQMKKS